MQKHQNLIQSSYQAADVTFLLQDVSDLVEELTIAEKEQRIQSGESYAGFLSKEGEPTTIQQELFTTFMEAKATRFASEIAQLAERIYQVQGPNFILVSLARAGTPIGILLRRYFAIVYALEIPHYSISILRGQGIDEAALNDLVQRYGETQLQFVDGWTGKGSIIDELEAAITKFNTTYQQSLQANLAVVADPAKRCQLYGTRADVAIPNCFFNATISGLVSRTVSNERVQQVGHYHGARYLAYLEEFDQSGQFIEQIGAYFCEQRAMVPQITESIELDYAQKIVTHIQMMYAVRDRHKIKLSVGEAARVLLRRSARCLLVQNREDDEVALLVALAKLKGVPIIEVDISVLKNYRAAAIIHE
ncbi:MAG: cysteine protease StiP domain-containing protein [Culicoidibacterales bacterium]